MKNLKLNKTNKKYQLGVADIEKVVEELKDLYINYNDVEESIYNLDKLATLQEYAEELDVDNFIVNAYDDFEYFFEIYFSTNDLSRLANAVCYGDYNGNHDYIWFDGYENLKTMDKWEYERLVEENFESNFEDIKRIAFENDLTDEIIQYKEMLEYIREKEAEYKEFSEKRQKDFDKLPLGFAFSDKQFNETMEKWGLNPNTDTNKIVSIGHGGFIQKKDAPLIKAHTEKYNFLEKINKSNVYYILGGFTYELGNHEYIYNYDAIDEAIEALGLSKKELQKYSELLEIARRIEYSLESRHL